MPNPIVEEKTEDGDTRSKLKPGNLDPGEGVQLTLKRVSVPRESEYGAYVFAEVVTETGEQHRVIVSANTKAPGFVDNEETAFGEACKEELGKYPERKSNGRSLADCFYEAPTDDSRTKLIRFVEETDDGTEYSVYWFGVPKEASGGDEDQGGGGEIRWRE